MNIIESITKRLKSKTILDRKPNLKICSNHLHPERGKAITRYWPSRQSGQAISDGNG